MTSTFTPNKHDGLLSFVEYQELKEEHETQPDLRPAKKARFVFRRRQETASKASIAPSSK